MAFGFGGSPRLTLQEQVSLARAPRRDGKIGSVDGGDAVRKILNGPNTVLRLGYGGIGHIVGEVVHGVTPKQRRPKVVVGDNAVQFRDNPFGGVSAITIGNTSTYSPGSATPSAMRHETQHTYQGEKVGPGYLPMNVVGGLTALLIDRDKNGWPDWHGPHNWMGRGPLSTPPGPWLQKAPR